MAKIHKNAEKFPIQWDGDLTQFGGDKDNDNIPSNVDIKWGGGLIRTYVACHSGGGASQCTADVDSYYFEDFDVTNSGTIYVADIITAGENGAPTAFTDRLTQIVSQVVEIPPNAPIAAAGTDTFTWGDAQFIQEIVDGIGTGSRRERQDRLNKILDDEDKKKKLIHLICRVKGEKVYDDYTEVGKIEVKVEDVEMVTENIIGKVKLEIKSGL